MALVIVDQALYVEGARRPCGDLSDELAALRAAGAPGDFLWIGLKDPTQAEFDEVNEELQLHPLAVEDAIQGRQTGQGRALRHQRLRRAQAAALRRRDVRHRDR